MEKKTKKTAFVLIGILAFSLVIGNALFAGDASDSFVGLLTEQDNAFVTGNFSESTASPGAVYSESTTGLVANADVEFLAEPFNGALVSAGTNYDNSVQNVVSSSDLNFIQHGIVGSDLSNLVCMIDGVQATGQACVN
jgi:hypothetical protein